MNRADYVEGVIDLARTEYQFPSGGAVQIDADADIADGAGNGTFVQAWVWVDFAGTQFDKEKQT